MNLFHQRLCRSERWAHLVEEQLVPWALAGVRLGDNVLEIGPGYGATTRALVDRVPRLTAVEVDPVLTVRLRGQLGGKVTVLEGDGTAIPLPDNEFSSVVCFTMLHHVPSPQLQDRLFAQACRVLRPGGVFAGSDSLPSLRFRLVHLFDTMVVINPDTLADRLLAAGFADPVVTAVPAHRLRWQARKPAA